MGKKRKAPKVYCTSCYARVSKANIGMFVYLGRNFCCKRHMTAWGKQFERYTRVITYCEDYLAALDTMARSLVERAVREGVGLDDND
jgi:hypothetical protein